MKTAPSLVECQAMPANRSPALAASCRDAISWVAARKLTPSRCAGASFRHVLELFCMHTDTSGGSGEAQVDEPAAMPTGPPAPKAQMAAAPVGKQANAWRGGASPHRPQALL